MTELDPKTQQILADPKRRRAWISFQLTERGTSLAEVARNGKVKRQTLYRVFDRRYPRMQRLVADALRMEPQVLFPERYDADGLPIRYYGQGKSTKKRTDKTVNKRRTARNVN
jgi:Ner family transcriptional regulator